MVMGDSDKDNDDNQLLNTNFIHLLLLYATMVGDGTCDSFEVRESLEWESHSKKLIKERKFTTMYRMPPTAFNKLCNYLDPLISVDPVMGELRTKEGIISTKIVVACFIRWISGGQYHDIRLIGGMSTASFYRVMWRCAAAILDHELAYSFPQTREAIYDAASSFRALSTNNLITGCVGVMDGLLLHIKVPSSKAVGNVKSFFSGHYRAYIS
jgi:hypothetical protein